MIINFDNIGGGGGGGQYVLPVATANRLGGIKVGSGLTIDSSGVLSTSGGTAPSGDNIKVYDFWDLYSGITYDHNDSGVPQEMIDLASSGTPVYVLYTTEHWTVYMSMIDKTGQNGTIHFAGFAGDRYFYCTLVNNESWYMSQVGQSSLGNYKVVDALSAITNPTEGMVATEKTTVKAEEFERVHAITPEEYPTEGYWAFIKNVNNDDDGVPIYMSNNEFYWDWYNDNFWHTKEWEGNYFSYRVNRGNDSSVPTFDVKFPEGSPLYVNVDGGAVGQIGITTGLTENVVQTKQPQIYQQNKWTPLYPVFEFAGFATSAETAEFIAFVKDLIDMGRYPSLYYKKTGRNFFLNFEGYADDWITFTGSKDWNCSYRVYFSDTIFDDNGFNNAGIREDENNYDEPTLFRAIWQVDSGGTIETYGEPWLIDYDPDFARLYLQGAREEGDPPGSLSHMEFKSAYRTLVQNPDSGENELRDYFVFGGKVFVKNVEYYGVWGMLRDDWQIETLSWTSGATYESQNYPIYTGSTGE